MVKVKAQSQARKKKKKWVQINSPKIFGEKKIGETFVEEAENAVGKRVEQNLMSLTGEMKKQNITIKFVIDKVTGSVAHTVPVKYTMAPSFIKRLVRRRRNRIDISNVYTTKDNIKVRIKPLIITNTDARGSVLTSLRRKADALLAGQIKKMKYLELFENVISYNLQGTLKRNLKKIHPLRNCEVRVLEKEDKNQEVIDETKEAEEEKKEESSGEEKEKEPKKESLKKTSKKESSEDKGEKKASEGEESKETEDKDSSEEAPEKEDNKEKKSEEKGE
ncbi:MAG: hypothetical protein ACQEP1_04605 [Nanobdellota archaeon]